ITRADGQEAAPVSLRPPPGHWTTPSREREHKVGHDFAPPPGVGGGAWAGRSGDPGLARALDEAEGLVVVRRLDRRGEGDALAALHAADRGRDGAVDAEATVVQHDRLLDGAGARPVAVDPLGGDDLAGDLDTPGLDRRGLRLGCLLGGDAEDGGALVLRQ